MSGEYGGWNGSRDFPGDGGAGKGGGIAWDSTQNPLCQAAFIKVSKKLTVYRGAPAWAPDQKADTWVRPYGWRPSGAGAERGVPKLELGKG